jgi:hypothetical protein
MAHTTDTIMMVRPANFGFNAETAENNAFQSNDRGESKQEIANQARDEFDEMVKMLRSNQKSQTPFFQITGFHFMIMVLWLLIQCLLKTEG